ncbi:MAG: YetF domain-containing protein [Acidobacteriota bacterium]
MFFDSWQSLARTALAGLVAYVTSRPAAVFQAGTFDDKSMMRERVTRDEILMAMRSADTRDLGRVSVVMLEPDGSFSVIHELGDRPPIDVAVDRAP